MKKIFVVILNDVINTVGGAITVFDNFTQMLIDNGYQVTGIFAGKKYKEKTYIKQNGIKLYNFCTVNTENIIREENPDLMVFFYPRDVHKVLKSEIFKNIPKILMNHTRPDFYVEYELIKNQLADFSAVQVLFDSFKSMVQKYFNGPVVTIGNEVPSFEQTAEKKEFKNIIYLSRVDIWKGHEFLINSFSKIAKKYPDWKLNIYGQFDPKRYKKYLENLIKKHGLCNQIILNGATDKPYKKLKESDFCVFPSYFEGFGLGLAEALSLGLPAIGLKGATGVNELIVDGENGFLVSESEDEFVEKIEFLINNRDERLEMSHKASISMKKYSKQIISTKWLNLIKNLLNNNIVCDNIEENFIKYENFSMEKIYKIMFEKRCMSFVQKIFSVSNLGKEKMVCILGLKFKIKRI